MHCDTESCMYFMQTYISSKKAIPMPDLDNHIATSTVSHTSSIQDDDTHYSPEDESEDDDSAILLDSSDSTKVDSTLSTPAFTPASTNTHSLADDSEDDDSGILLYDSDSDEGDSDLSDCDANLERKPYEIKEMRGKGLAVVATRPIRRGERILVEKSLIRHARNFDDSDVINQYNLLTRSQKSEIGKLCNVRPGQAHPVLGIIWTNSICISKQESGLFITASRINHACAPNTFHSWNENLNAITTHVTADIRKGEEITNSYINGVALRDDRINLLARNFGFICKCSRCLMEGAHAKQSDKRLRRIADLEKILQRALPEGRTGTPSLSLYRDAHMLLSLYEAELITDSRVAQVYLYTFRLSCLNHLGARVVESAERALQIMTEVKGDDHPDTQFWKTAAEATRSHIKRPGCAAKDMCPEDEDDEDRRAWLFMDRGRAGVYDGDSGLSLCDGRGNCPIVCHGEQ